jgi:hypothetical protein
MDETPFYFSNKPITHIIKLELKDFKLHILQLKNFKFTAALIIGCFPESNITHFIDQFIVISN